MTTIYLAHTVAVNQPGQEPVLSEAQLFAGFQRKIRNPQEFVPVIAACEVLSDQDGVVTRRATFKPQPGSAGPGPTVTEVCTEHPPHRVDFVMDTGSTVLNIVSAGSSGAPTDLFVTYSFGWKHPELVAGSAEAKAAEARYKAIAKEAVESSLATTRRLVREGVLA